MLSRNDIMISVSAVTSLSLSDIDKLPARPRSKSYCDSIVLSDRRTLLLLLALMRRQLMLMLLMLLQRRD